MQNKTFFHSQSPKYTATDTFKLEIDWLHNDTKECLWILFSSILLMFAPKNSNLSEKEKKYPNVFSMTNSKHEKKGKWNANPEYVFWLYYRILRGAELEKSLNSIILFSKSLRHFVLNNMGFYWNPHFLFYKSFPLTYCSYFKVLCLVRKLQ